MIQTIGLTIIIYTNALKEYRTTYQSNIQIGKHKSLSKLYFGIGDSVIAFTVVHRVALFNGSPFYSSPSSSS